MSVFYIISLLSAYSIAVAAIIVAVVWTSIVSYGALMICKVTVGLRVKEQQEREGLDVVDHGERAYN